MTIEVDDAGWGDPVGGCVIVLRRVETGESFVGEIPLRFFQGEEFKRKKYLDEACRVVRRGLEKLRASKEELIKVCTGYVLSKVRARLTEEGYRVKPSRITGETQILAEQSYLRSIERYGVNVDGLSLDSGVNRFLKLIDWILEDPGSRVRYSKTGWKALRKKWLKGYL